MPPDVQPETSEPEPPKKNRPKATRLRQQKLPAWQPILTASTVIPTVFCVGIIFIPIGIALLLASQGVKEKIIKYANVGNCKNQHRCDITVTLDEEYSNEVFFYYYLENFYQNHRRYVKSRNDQQYLGVLGSTSDCEPFATADNKPIVPCGAIANSMFNDTFEMTGPSGPVPFTTEGVLWDVDKERKFKNPEIPAGGTLCSAFTNTTKPPNWPKPICEIGGLENVDFIVWMRTAALPNFRKLWRKLDISANSKYPNGLPAGQYTISIKNNYPVAAFGGDKGFIISTASWAGGKNSFLGIAYLVVGGIALILGVVFVAIHIRFGHSFSELSNLHTT